MKNKIDNSAFVPVSSNLFVDTASQYFDPRTLTRGYNLYEVRSKKCECCSSVIADNVKVGRIMFNE